MRAEGSFGVVTKEMVLEGLKQGIVTVGEYGNSSVCEPSPEATMDELACEIGDNAFYFNGSCDGTIAEYLAENDADTIAGNVLEGLECVRDEFDRDEYDYYEFYLRANLENKNILPKYFMLANTFAFKRAFFDSHEPDKEKFRKKFMAGVEADINSGVAKLGLSPREGFLCLSENDDAGEFDENDYAFIEAGESIGSVIAEAGIPDFSINFMENEKYFRYVCESAAYSSYSDVPLKRGTGVIIPKSWASEVAVTGEFDSIIHVLSEKDERVKEFFG